MNITSAFSGHLHRAQFLFSFMILALFGCDSDSSSNTSTSTSTSTASTTITTTTGSSSNTTTTSTATNTSGGNIHTLVLPTVNSSGQSLKLFLLNLNVLNRWLPNNYVEWRTGVTIYPSQQEIDQFSLPYTSHCSAYAASAAEQLGITLLNPETSPAKFVLLANHQNTWLNSKTATQAGWKEVHLIEAQASANLGKFVVASFPNPNAHAPGHIAIVMPDETATTASVLSQGPTITQAGSPSDRVPDGNSQGTSTINGFYLHTHGSLTGIQFFVNN